MPILTITPEELHALIAERDRLRGELQVVKGERDLLQEKLKAYLRQLFAASSEARGTNQQDRLLNDAEVLAPGSETPVAMEDDAADSIEVAGHRRAKLGRKPLDPALPREVGTMAEDQATALLRIGQAELDEVGEEEGVASVTIRSRAS